MDALQLREELWHRSNNRPYKVVIQTPGGKFHEVTLVRYSPTVNEDGTSIIIIEAMTEWLDD